MTIIPVVAFALVVERQLLLVRKRGTTKFMLPGGKFEIDETDLDCLHREVLEELSCQIELDTLRFLGEFTTAAANESNTLIIARTFQGQVQGQPTASGEIEEICWLSGNDYVSLSLAPLLLNWVIPRLQELKQL